MTDTVTQADRDHALKWINHNLMLAKGLMKSSSEAGNGAENFRAHDAHQALTVAKNAITAWNTRAASNGEGADWRDIASAPKDGRNILVIGQPPLWDYPFVVYWDANAEDGAGWWRHTDPSLDALYGVSDSITHWMPCPSLSATPAQEVDETERLRKAAQALLDGLTSTYTARNGREVGIQGDDGEKCYIVHSDLVFDLRAALSLAKGGE